MRYLDLTLSTPAENLACDEALLDSCEEDGGVEILRVWEPSEYFVVVGYANKINVEVNVENCRAKGIPVLRRCSGGGAIVQGPGCLNYSVVLNFKDNSLLQTITQANRFVMNKHLQLFQSLLGSKVAIEGHTDLTSGGLKFSGNAQRRKKSFLLFHGTLLLDFDLALIEQVLRLPSQQPSYRQDRSHKDFLVNLPLSAAEIKERLRQVWSASGKMEIRNAPDERVFSDLHFKKDFTQLPLPLLEKYRSDAWNWKF